MRFGCCVSTLEHVQILADAGYDYCELPARVVQPLDAEAAAVPALRAFDAAPLRAEAFNVLVPPQLPLVGAHADLDVLRTYFRQAFGRMVQLGGAVVVLGSGQARHIPDAVPRHAGLDQLANALAVAADEATRAGIVLALEPLNHGECNVFNTLAESRAFITNRNLDDVKLLADLHHIELEREPFAEVIAAAPLLAHVHVADGGRRAPGAGGYDYDGFMAALHKASYDQRISAECGWDDLQMQAAEALIFMRTRWAQADSQNRTRASDEVAR